MVVSKIGSSDIRNLGAYGQITAVLPDFATIESVKSIVTRIKSRYPREDGLTYTTSVDKSTNTITIKVVKPEDVLRKNK